MFPYFIKKEFSLYKFISETEFIEKIMYNIKKKC